MLPCINGDLKWLALSSCSPSHIIVVVVLLVLIFTINIILAPPHRLNNASTHGNSSYLRLSNRVKTHTRTRNYRVEIGGLGEQLGHAWQTHGGVAVSWHFCQGTQCGQTHPIGPSHANSRVIFLMMWRLSSYSVLFCRPIFPYCDTIFESWHDVRWAVWLRSQTTLGRAHLACTHIGLSSLMSPIHYTTLFLFSTTARSSPDPHFPRSRATRHAYVDNHALTWTSWIPPVETTLVAPFMYLSTRGRTPSI